MEDIQNEAPPSEPPSPPPSAQAEATAPITEKAVAKPFKQSAYAKAKQTAVEKGVGVSQYTIALHPFRSVSVSAKPKLKTTVDQGQFPPSKVTPWQPGTRGPIEFNSPLLAALSEPTAVEAFVRDRFEGEPVAREALLDDLRVLQEAAGLTHTQAGQFAQALRLVYPQASEASTAVSELRRIDLLKDLTQLDLHAEPAPHGWLLAARLESIQGIGLDLLEKTSNRPVLDNLADEPRVTLSSAQRGAIRAYFRAAALTIEPGADANGAQGTQGSFQPQAVYQRGNLAAAISQSRNDGDERAWPGRAGQPTPEGIALSLAEKALLAVPDLLAPPSPTPHGCAFAAHMIRGGLTTDAKTGADGKPTEFHRIELEASKMLGRRLNRTLGGRTSNPLAHFIRQRILHKGKSPFQAHDAILSTRGQQRGVGLSHQGGIHEGRAVRDMIDVLERELTARLAGHGNVGEIQDASVDEAELPRLCTRLAMLQTLKANQLLLPRYASNAALRPELAEAVQQRLDQLLASHGGQTAPLDPQARAQLVREEMQRGVGVEALSEWARGLGFVASAEAGQDGWHAFSQALEVAAASRGRPLQAPAPMKGLTRSDAAAVLADMIKGEELGSGFSLTDQRVTKFNTSGVNEPLTLPVAHFLPINLQLNGGGSRKRAVVFESGVNTDRSYLRMGVATANEGQVSESASVGYKLGKVGIVKVAANAGTSSDQSGEWLKQTGVVFGFPRHLSGGVMGDRELSAQKAKLIRLLVQVAGGEPAPEGMARPGNPEDQGSLVKAAYQAFGSSISVGGYEIKQRMFVGTHSAFGGLGLSIGPYGIGVPQLKQSTQALITQASYRDTSGYLRANKDTQSTLYKLNASISASGPATSVAAVHNLAGLHGVSAATRIAAGNMINVAADYARDGRADTVIRIYDDDKELPTSFATATFSSIQAFEQALNEDLDGFAGDKAKRFPGADAGAAEGLSEAVEKQALVDFVTRLKHDGDLTALPQLYWEFGSRVDAAVQLDGLADLARHQGQGEVVKKAQRELDTLHQDPRYREGRFLISINARQAAETVGLNGIAGLTHSQELKITEQSIRFT